MPPDMTDLSNLTDADFAARRQRADALHRAGLPSPYPETWTSAYEGDDEPDDEETDWDAWAGKAEHPIGE